MDIKAGKKRGRGRPSNKERGIVGRIKANTTFRPDTGKQLGTITLSKMIADIEGLNGWGSAVDFAIEKLAREMGLL